MNERVHSNVLDSDPRVGCVSVIDEFRIEWQYCASNSNAWCLAKSCSRWYVSASSCALELELVLELWTNKLSCWHR